MSDFSSQEQWKRGENPASRAGVSNLIPFKPGQSGNPGGVKRGTVMPAEAYKRLGALGLEALKSYPPRNVIELGVKNCFLRAAEADDWRAAHAAMKEIADRIEGKAVARTADVSAEEAKHRAQVLFTGLRQSLDNLAGQVRVAIEGIRAGNDPQAELGKLLQELTVSDDDVISAVLGAFDEGQQETVRRALEE